MLFFRKRFYFLFLLFFSMSFTMVMMKNDLEDLDDFQKETEINGINKSEEIRKQIRGLFIFWGSILSILLMVRIFFFIFFDYLFKKKSLIYFNEILSNSIALGEDQNFSFTEV